MKITITLSLLAATLLFASCGGGKKTTKAQSLPEQIADCVCVSINEMAKLKKQIQAATTEEKKAEIVAKLTEFKEPACMKDLEDKMKALSAEQQAKIETEMKAALDKKCGHTMKSIMGD
jgi:hypothetical protein